MRLKYIVFLCFILKALPIYGQLNDAAQKSYEKAMAFMLKKDKAKAIAHMTDAIRQDKTFADAYSALGEWYFRDHKYAQAVHVFKDASNNCRNGAKLFALPLAKSYLSNYEPNVALQIINSFGTVKERNNWTLLREQAYFMRQALAQPLPDTPRNMGIRINTPEPEMYPCLTADTLNLFFTRRLNGIDDDFYTSQVDSCGGWFTARNMGSPPNTLHHESAQTISGDGHYLFFMRCDNRSENGWDQGGCDLYMAYTADSIWSQPETFGATINTPAYEGMPCLSPDNRELYYVSNREGGFGGMDIWMSKFENGLWQAPRNLGPEVNTPGDETAPFIHIDNNTLYFASNGHPGMGGTDLYYSRRINDTTWGGPQNMGYPLNTAADENSICVTIDGQRAYLASDRDSAGGNFDIYETHLPRQLQPVPVAIIKGFSVDSISREKLTYTSIYINDPKTNTPAYHYVSNRGDGSYMITLPAGYNYTYAADRIGYSEVTGNIDLTGKENIEKLSYDIALLPQGYQKPIHDTLIATIHFPINSKNLSDSAKAAIQNIMSPWLDQRDIIVIVNGYTDNSGNPLLNEELSYLRAGLVGTEISTLGIDPVMIEARGWGEANPVAPNETDENRNLNRRVEIIIRR